MGCIGLAFRELLPLVQNGLPVKGPLKQVADSLLGAENGALTRSCYANERVVLCVNGERFWALFPRTEELVLREADHGQSFPVKRKTGSFSSHYLLVGRKRIPVWASKRLLLVGGRLPPPPRTNGEEMEQRRAVARWREVLCDKLGLSPPKS